MEFLLQYWDDLDDMLGMLGLFVERLRRLLLFTLSALVFSAFVAGSILLALAEPPLALAVATLLGVVLLYRAVTGPRVPHTA